MHNQDLSSQAIVAFYSGSFSEAERLFRETQTIYREKGASEASAQTAIYLGRLAFIRGEFQAVKILAVEALNSAGAGGNDHLKSEAQSLLSMAELPDIQPSTSNQAESPIIRDLPTHIDRFAVKRWLGEGDQSLTYLAVDPANEREVVIRMPKSSWIETFDNIATYQHHAKQQAETMQNWNHAAIPQLYSYHVWGDQIYTVEELVDGQTLDVVLDSTQGFVSERWAIDWAIQVCDALVYLHSQSPTPFIHRDIKDNNLMVDRQNCIHIIDNGLVVPYQAGQLQNAVGTVGYAPPEQYFGYVDGRSDVYALGVTLLQIVTHRNPRHEPSFSHHSVLPRSLNRAISEALCAVILKSVQHNPDLRYQSAMEMKAALVACRE